MYKTTENETKEKIAVDVNSLASMLCIGRNSAYDVGKAAGAVIKVGAYFVQCIESKAVYGRNKRMKGGTLWGKQI